VLKKHSSYRPFPTIRYTGCSLTRKGVFPIKERITPRRKDRNEKIIPTFDDRVTMLYFYTVMKPDILDAMSTTAIKGGLGGTGLGHINKKCIRPLKEPSRGVHQT
jgi:L-asparaginase/Glu-tRNA(Gln) amidotransferase subunit D